MGSNPTSYFQSIGKSTSFQIQPLDGEDDENIQVLHRNMLFPVQLVTDPISKTDGEQATLMKANLLMDLYFYD